MSLLSCAVVTLMLTTGQASLSGAPDDDEREARTQFLQARADELALLRLDKVESPLERLERPVLRYSNPVGQSSDGATYLWLAGKRPAGVVSFSIRRPNDAVYRECTSLWPQPLDCRQNAMSVWSPKKGGLIAQKLPDAAAPGTTEARRLSQMREITKRFSATWHHSRTGERTELKVLPAPLYRFAAENEGIVDGALFALVITNDPEMLLLLEAARERPEAAATWRYSLARMSSLQEVVRLDDQEIWSVPHFHSDPNDDRLTGPYSEQRIGTFKATSALSPNSTK